MFQVQVAPPVPSGCVGVGVVVVAAFGTALAVGEDAVHVAQVDLVLEPVGDLVGLDVVVGGEVLDRDDGDLGGGVAPGADLLDQGRGAGGAAPADVAGAGQGFLGEVDVQHHAPAASAARAGLLTGLARW